MGMVLGLEVDSAVGLADGLIDSVIYSSFLYITCK